MTNVKKTLENLRGSLPTSIDAETFAELEKLTVKQLRQYAYPKGILNPQDEKASVVSVIVWIIVAKDPTENPVQTLPEKKT